MEVFQHFKYPDTIITYIGGVLEDGEVVDQDYVRDIYRKNDIESKVIFFITNRGWWYKATIIEE